MTGTGDRWPVYVVCWSQATHRRRAAPREYLSGNSWEAERREVLESVLSELRSPELDASGYAACADLLRHLAHGSETLCSSRSRS